MKRMRNVWVAALGLAIALAAGAQPSLAAEPSAGAAAAIVGNGRPLADLITAIARKTGKRFVVDPRVQAQAVATFDPSHMSYDDFLEILQVHGYAAIDRGDVVLIVPDGAARAYPSPLVAGNEKLPGAEIVTSVIHVHSIPAAHLVPILRPLIPMYGHLAASVCTNDLILVDRFANVKRIEAMIQTMDKGEAYKPEKCAPTLSPPLRSRDDGRARPERD